MAEASTDEIRILVARSPFYRLSWLCKLIEMQDDMRVVRDEQLDPVELLLAVRETKADVVVLGLTEQTEDPGICTNLLSEYPRLLILALSEQGNEAFLYQQSVLKQALPAASDQYILKAIRTGEVNSVL